MFTFQRGDKVFHYAPVDLEELGSTVLEIAGAVLRVDGNQAEFMSYWGTRRMVDTSTLAPRAEDKNVWLLIDEQPLPE